jgi:ferredoxin-NADP reductase
MSEYKYYIKKIYQPTPDQLILEVGNRSGEPVFNYRPGQYAMISYKNSQGRMEDKHAFSIASSPTQKQSIVFGIKIQGLFTQGLLNLKEGDELVIFGPYGNFVYNEKKYSDLVMIAGGIGITPFFSTLNYANDLKLPNKLSLIYSTRTLSSATFFNEINTLEKNNSNISALFSFTEESSVSQDKRVLSQRIDKDIIKNFIGDVQGKTFFICGPSLFMRAMVDNLISLGVTKNKIEMEEFSMIPDDSLWSRLRNLSYATGTALILFTIVFGLVSRPVATVIKKNYDQILVSKANQTAYDRMISIYETKNKALADLNAQILAATKNSNTQVVTSTVKQSNSSNSAVIVTPVITPPTTVITQPTQIIPTPRTRVS